MTDLHAAAERIVYQWDNHDSQLVENAVWGEPVPVKLARAYLAEHPADDGELIDRDWLESIGLYGRSLGQIELSHRDGTGWFFSVLADEHGIYWSTIDKPFHTRGQLRRLAAALGIELREGNQ